VIVGRALYDGRIDLREALSRCTPAPPPGSPG
jgi:phosphoribosylformimino-5-aminoimidazole carboxamide ribonucleotide (ProFAR) isomerase